MTKWRTGVRLCPSTYARTSTIHISLHPSTPENRPPTHAHQPTQLFHLLHKQSKRLLPVVMGVSAIPSIYPPIHSPTHRSLNPKQDPNDSHTLTFFHAKQSKRLLPVVMGVSTILGVLPMLVLINAAYASTLYILGTAAGLICAPSPLSRPIPSVTEPPSSHPKPRQNTILPPPTAVIVPCTFLAGILANVNGTNVRPLLLNVNLPGVLFRPDGVETCIYALYLNAWPTKPLASPEDQPSQTKPTPPQHHIQTPQKPADRPSPWPTSWRIWGEALGPRLPTA